jgi:hypothetical protein
MTIALIGLTAGFVLLSALLFLLWLKSPLPQGWKWLALIAVIAFFWVEYGALKRYAGWPTGEALPQRFRLIASEVIEPDKKTREDGIMYWWLRDLDHPDWPPRVYQLPYEAQAHEQSAQVLEEQSKGAAYVGRRKARGAAAGNGLGVEFEKIARRRPGEKQ